MSDDTTIQNAFNEMMKARLADPMVTDEERTKSTLDVFHPETGPVGELDAFEFDEAPGDFENDVLARLENLENGLEEMRVGVKRIVDVVEVMAEQVEPTLKLITESKLFRMFVPKGKS